MKILNGKEQDYKEWYENQGADYGRACFRFAEKWAELLEELIENSSGDPTKIIIENADRTSHNADTEGITGFMYGAAVNILSICWEHGEALRKWHNKEYDYNGDGVVNPAVLSIHQ